MRFVYGPVPCWRLAKLDVGEERLFREVNRPRIVHSLAEVVQGICTFRQRFGGRLALGLSETKEPVAVREGRASIATRSP